MSDTTKLANQFDKPGLISVGPGNGGLTRVLVTAPGSCEAEKSVAEIYLNGATVTRYEFGDRQVLFCSRTSKYEAGKAIRGGVPVIFPWFGAHPSSATLPQHGFVRAMEWTIESTQRYATGEAAVTLTLESGDATRAIWPYDFLLRYTITVGKRLFMALEVTNRSAIEFRFEEALHTYLAVSDVRKIQITGLEQTEYLDKVQGMERFRLSSEPLMLHGETDRVFVNTGADCVLRDPVAGETVVAKEASLSTIVWNPWQTKAEALADLVGEQWPGMVCIETANAGENGVLLAPGSSHTMTAVISPPRQA